MVLRHLSFLAAHAAAPAVSAQTKASAEVPNTIKMDLAATDAIRSVLDGAFDEGHRHAPSAWAPAAGRIHMFGFRDRSQGIFHGVRPHLMTRPVSRAVWMPISAPRSNVRRPLRWVWPSAPRSPFLRTISRPFARLLTRNAPALRQPI